MGDFRQLTDKVWASPQIDLSDVTEAAARGFTLIVNNRPDGESPDQTPGGQIAAAAQAAGLGYLEIPITHSGFSHPQVAAMADALATAAGPVLAYCRSGTRSTLLWALASASQGDDPEAIATAAMRAGYDIGPVWPMVEAYAAQSGR